MLHSRRKVLHFSVEHIYRVTSNVTMSAKHECGYLCNEHGYCAVTKITTLLLWWCICSTITSRRCFRNLNPTCSYSRLLLAYVDAFLLFSNWRHVRNHHMFGDRCWCCGRLRCHETSIMTHASNPQHTQETFYTSLGSLSQQRHLDGSYCSNLAVTSVTAPFLAIWCNDPSNLIISTAL
jgi:hypothetical protein